MSEKFVRGVEEEDGELLDGLIDGNFEKNRFKIFN